MTTPETSHWTDSAAAWPPLPLEAWKDTCDTLHMWTQIVGKIRLALTPRVNHFWHCALYVTPRGLTTSAIPYGSGTFEMRFDFLAHELVIDVSDGATRRLRLAPRTVADFYGDVMETLRGARDQRADRTDAGRGAEPDPISRGHDARVVRSGVCDPLLAGARGRGHGVEGVSGGLHGEV